MSSTPVATAYVDMKPDFSGFNREVASKLAPITKNFGGQFGKALGPVLEKQAQHMRTLATGAKYAAAGGAALAVVVGKDIVTAGMKFEKQMSVNAAVSAASRKEMLKLERQSLKLGKATFFSASEAAEAQGELVKGGLKVGQVLGGGLPAALQLAEAGQLELAVAAETTVNAMKLFGLEGKEAGSVADMLSTAANRTTADVLDFAMALKQGGSVTKLAGYEMNETVTVLEALAEAGIKNSDAGTSMKTAVIQLLKPSTKQAELAKELNLQFVSQEGHLKSAAGLSKELHRVTDDMTKAEKAKVLATLAGTDGVRTLNALVSETPKELRALERANARQGTAQDIATKKMDNFAGTWEQFKGTLETVEIQIYKGAAPALEELTEEATHAASRVGAVFDNPNLSGGEKVERAISVLRDELGRIWDRNEMSEHLLDALDYALDTVVPHMAENAGELGLAAAKGFVHGFTHADFLGKVVMGAWLLNSIGGKAAFVGLGRTVGKQFGVSFVTTAAAEVAASGAAAKLTGSAAAGALGSGFIGRMSAAERARLRAAGIGSLTKQTEAQALASQGGIFRNVAGGGAAAGGMSLLGAAAIPAAIGGLGLYEVFTSTGRDLGNRLAGAIGESLNENLGPAVEKGLAHKDLGELLSLRRSVQQTLNAAIATGADEASLKPLRDKLSGLDREIGKVQIPRSVAFDQIDALRSGLVTRMADINELFRANIREINQGWLRGSDQWRSVTAKNMRGTVEAIRSGMRQGVIETDAGKARIKTLLEDLRLVEGRDPLGLAQGFANGWRDAGRINNREIGEAIRDLKRMPKGARESAQDAMIQMARTMEAKGDLVKGSAGRLQSALVTKFGRTNRQLVKGVGGAVSGIAGLFDDLGGAVAEALKGMGLDVNAALKAFGIGKTIDFTLHAGGAAGSAIGRAVEDIVPGLQTGGVFTVPGSGSGDTFRTALPPGSFVENREAVRKLPLTFQGGGLMPVALEPGERVWLPEAVQAVGQKTLEARNSEVPRFGLQRGGHLGSEPQLGGPDPLRSLGQAGIHMGYEAAKRYLQKHSSGLGSMGVHGSVGDHPELQAGISAIVATILKRWPGLAITSTTGGGHATNSLHYQGRAVDLAASSAYMLQAAAWIKANLGAQLTEGIHNPNLSVKYGEEVSPSFWGSEVWGDHLDHIHAGKQLGGLIQELAIGGGVNINKTFPGAIYPSAEWSSLPELAFPVAAALAEAAGKWAGTGMPGVTMAQVSKGEGALKPGSRSTDDGWGWLAITRPYGDSYGVGGFGGYEAMLNPVLNAAVAARMFGAQGLGAWYGQKFVTSSNAHYSGDYDIRNSLGGKTFGEAVGHPNSGEGGGGGSEHIPAEVGYHIKGGATGAGGGTTAPAKGRVKTEKLSDFGSLPDTIPAVQRELSKRRAELGRYRAALRSNKDPDVKDALEANVNLLRNRILALKEQRDRLLRKKAQEAVAKKIAKRGTLPGFEEAIASAERAYESVSEEAQQIVSLEPEEGPAVKSYIEGQEAPAWARVLSSEARWRNALLAGESAAAVRLRDLEGQQERLNALKVTNPKAFNEQKYRLPAIRQSIASIKGLYTPPQAKSLKDLEAGRFSVVAGGEFEDSLVSLQGIGKSTVPMDVLPSEPVAGSWGGLIFDTQMSIRELGLKLKQAGETGGEDNSELLAAIREIAERERKGRYVAERLSATSTAFDNAYPNGAMPPYAGKAHTGAIVPGPPTEERTMILRGQERIRTPEQELAMARAIRETGGQGGGMPIVETHVHGDIISDRDDPVETVLRDPRTKRVIQRTRGGRVTAGGARR